MNTKTALAILVVAVVVVVGFFILHPTGTPNPALTASTTPQTASTTNRGASTQPSITVGPAIKTVATFDANSLISSSTYPVITGTANVPSITVIIDNSKGVGVVGSSNVAVVDGHWSYADSVSLPPGNYTVVLLVGKTITAGGELTVR